MITSRSLITRSCINVCHFLFLFARFLRDGDYRAVTTSSLSFERYLARGKDWVGSRRNRFLWCRCIWSRKLFELRIVFKDTFLLPLRAPERAETWSGNSNRSSKSSFEANFISRETRGEHAFFSPIKMLSRTAVQLLARELRHEKSQVNCFFC